jgi:ABC-2 type transport system ATP-binding protein
MPIIEVQSLSKSFQVADKQPGFVGAVQHLFNRRHRNIDAVKSVSFSIEPGEIVGFLGPNGAGKTTTLKMLTGLIHPTSGTVQVTGHTPFKREREFLRQITLVMGQKQQLMWDLPVLDSLRVNEAVYEIGQAECQKRTEQLSAMLGLEGKLTQPVRKLSLGERMKAELLAALIHRPDVLFLDEPTLGLDVNAQASVREFLRDYNLKHGATVLLTSHYMNDIVALCKRVIVIHQGALIYDGKLDEILARFAPYREVKIQLSRVHSDAELALNPVSKTVDGQVVTIIVSRDELTKTVSSVLSQWDVADLTVTDPPVEEIIGRIFTQSSGPSVSAPEATA